ncbi:NADase-type glycan-binding domain-containing protein [Mangrovivirga cuniculi]|uniref:AXH domain-containing protein n=1 Tax=Mangrovivirga cuniculi TaxID=2715131 RepID=A0A4D7JM23_9BACT|nr:hypothetical protein [Mangrovivirga cuniculi]QCK15697.1 hypothetical protein DCC35_13565 [Mangrovivirga cuniculi]
MKLKILIGLYFITQIAFLQIKEVDPSSVQEMNFSLEGEKAFNENYQACLKIWDKMSDGVDYDDLSQEEKDALAKVDETRESYWDIEGMACSWYCGGGPKSVTASSYLKPQGKNSYQPINAHDLNFKHAWVEGAPGNGIGEYLTYTFGARAPRITEIKVVNGYVKSHTAWINNSRVKKLKVYLDNKPFAILNLKDIRGIQSFKFDPIGKGWEAPENSPVWELKFEIIEVYKGSKYDDVVISEIFFDGIDVHCFAKGTKIQMADNSIKNIEKLEIGDKVAQMNLETMEITSARIEKLEKVIHHRLITYQFESGLKITATLDHPFMIQNKGWASFLPEQSSQYKGFENIKTIVPGDLFITSDGIERLVGLKFEQGDQETYTISKLSSGNNFIANGLVVGVEELNGKSSNQ